MSWQDELKETWDRGVDRIEDALGIENEKTAQEMRDEYYETRRESPDVIKQRIAEEEAAEKPAFENPDGPSGTNPGRLPSLEELDAADAADAAMEGLSNADTAGPEKMINNAAKALGGQEIVTPANNVPAEAVNTMKFQNDAAL